MTPTPPTDRRRDLRKLLDAADAAYEARRAAASKLADAPDAACARLLLPELCQAIDAEADATSALDGTARPPAREPPPGAIDPDSPPGKVWDGMLRRLNRRITGATGDAALVQRCMGLYDAARAKLLAEPDDWQALEAALALQIDRLLDDAPPCWRCEGEGLIDVYKGEPSQGKERARCDCCLGVGPKPPRSGRAPAAVTPPAPSGEGQLPVRALAVNVYACPVCGGRRLRPGPCPDGCAGHEPSAEGEQRPDPPPAAPSVVGKPGGMTSAPITAPSPSTIATEPQDVAALGLTPAQVEDAICAAALGLQWPPAVRPVSIDGSLWLNVSEGWSGDQPRLVTCCLQLIVPRARWDGPEPTAKTVYPPAGERLSYRGRLVLVNGAEYVMAGEDCERKVTWAVDDRLALPGEAKPAKERKPRKPRAKKVDASLDKSGPASEASVPAESVKQPNPPGVTFAGESWLVKVAPGCVLEVRADGGGWLATPAAGGAFGNWHDPDAETRAPPEDEIARKVGDAVGQRLGFLAVSEEGGKPVFDLRRKEWLEAGGAEGGLLFGPLEKPAPTAHEGRV